MKTLITLAAVIAVGATYWTVDNWPSTEGAMDTVMIDKTDHFDVRADADRLFVEFGWREVDQNLPRQLRIREITDVVQGPVHTLTLPGSNVLNRPSTWDGNTNGFFRQQEVKRFEDKVRDMITGVYDGEVGRPQTALLEPLVEECLIFQQHPGNRRTLHVFSDLGQHEKGFTDFLDGRTQSLLKADRERIWSQIPGASELTSLEGVHVFIVHHPGVEESPRFKLFASFLKDSLEPLGAQVTVTGAVEQATY